MSIAVQHISASASAATVVCDDVIAGHAGRRAGGAAGPFGLAARPRCCASSRASSVRTAGTVLFDGEDTTTDDVRERQVGFVFQHYALFAHMTDVRERRVRPARAAAKASAQSEAQIRGKVKDAAEAGAARLDRRPLSRTSSPAASASASPWRARSRWSRSVLLLDEPFGALDAKVRKELRRWLRRLHDELHVTSVFVTHDQEEALEVADRVVRDEQGPHRAGRHARRGLRPARPRPSCCSSSAT